MRIGSALLVVAALALAWIRQEAHDARQEAAAQAAVLALEQADVDLDAVREHLLAEWPSGAAWQDRGVRSAAVVGARMAAVGGEDTLPPLGGVVAEIRAGRLPYEGIWEMPGIAGLGALELGRRGFPSDRALLEWLVEEAPTAEDRLAARYALTRLDP